MKVFESFLHEGKKVPDNLSPLSNCRNTVTGDSVRNLTARTNSNWALFVTPENCIVDVTSKIRLLHLKIQIETFFIKFHFATDVNDYIRTWDHILQHLVYVSCTLLPISKTIFLHYRPELEKSEYHHYVCKHSTWTKIKLIQLKIEKRKYT